jgi:hypothetical protein
MANKFLEFTNKYGKMAAVQIKLVKLVEEYADNQDVNIETRILLKDSSVYLSRDSFNLLLSRLHS